MNWGYATGADITLSQPERTPDFERLLNMPRPGKDAPTGPRRAGRSHTPDISAC